MVVAVARHRHRFRLFRRTQRRERLGVGAVRSAFVLGGCRRLSRSSRRGLRGFRWRARRFLLRRIDCRCRELREVDRRFGCGRLATAPVTIGDVEAGGTGTAAGNVSGGWLDVADATVRADATDAGGGVARVGASDRACGIRHPRYICTRQRRLRTTWQRRWDGFAWCLLVKSSRRYRAAASTTTRASRNTV